MSTGTDSINLVLRRSALHCLVSMPDGPLYFLTISASLGVGNWVSPSSCSVCKPRSQGSARARLWVAAYFFRSTPVPQKNEASRLWLPAKIQARIDTSGRNRRTLTLGGKRLWKVGGASTVVLQSS